MSSDETSSEAIEPIAISPDSLQPETLERLAEEFILRGGFEEGDREQLLARVQEVVRALRRHKLRILFDPATESVGVFDG